MSNEETFHELRVRYRNRPAYVARLGSRRPTFGFERDFNLFFERREILPDGSRQEVHSLPDASSTYEVEEWRDGKWTRWFAATIEGDRQIHRITRYGALLVAREAMSIREVIREYPEMSQLEAGED